MKKTYDFIKNGYKFHFRNPEWKDYELVMEYKIDGIQENTKNDGYFYNSTYDCGNKAMIFYGVKIDGKEIKGVKLVDPILSEINNMYHEFKEKDYQNRVVQDIRYVLNDTDSYGIYNGISQYDIGIIITDVKKELDTDILVSNKRISKLLTNDEEIKNISKKTYIPYPEKTNWTNEYKKIYAKQVENKTAAGYGTIPNSTIREKIKKIILSEVEKEIEYKQKKEEHFNQLLEKAKETGENQLISSWYEPCNNPKEECSLDICSKYITPVGKIKNTRSHTW